MTNKKNKKEKQQLLLERIQEMCYFDDEFMTKCLENYPKGVELMLRIIMNNNKLVVKEAQVQAVIKNLQGRSISLSNKMGNPLLAVRDINHKYIVVDRARYFKKDKEGQEIMSKAMSDIVEEFINDEKIEAARRMLKKGKLTTEEISEYLDLPLHIVEELTNDLQPA